MSGASHNPHTRAIADFISHIKYEDIPAEVIARIKLLILDSLGCALYGSDLEWSRILRATLGKLDATKACRVWGTAERLSAPHAALVNGTLIQSFELDDVHRQGVLHVGAVTLPPLLAVTELRPGMSGRDFLRAAVAGYEIGPRVGKCMGQQHIGQGWHSGATVGVFSAAAGAAAALRLTREQAVHALGIAGTQSAGLMAAQYGAMVKRMHAGRAAQSGLYGALLAEAGFTGIVDVFESPYGGFCSTFSRSTDRFNLDELSWQLGRQWETMRISLKFYSCVGSNHTTLDAIRNMQEKTPFGADDIASIVVHGSQVTVEHVGWPYTPQGLTSAQLNLPFCVATLLLEGDVFVDQFTDDVVADQRRIDCRKRSAWWRTRRSRRAARTSGTWCASRCISKTASSSSRPSRRRAAAKRASPRKPTSCRSSRSSPPTPSATPRPTRSSISCSAPKSWHVPSGSPKPWRTADPLTFPW